MLENQFIQFSEVIHPLEPAIAVPTKNGIETRFFIDGEDLSIVTQDCSKTIQNNAGQSLGNAIAFDDLTCVAPHDCYRLKVVGKNYGTEIVQYGANKIEVSKNNWQVGSTYNEEITQEIVLGAGEHRLTIKDYYSRGWNQNGSPYNYETIIIVKDKNTNQEYTRYYHNKSISDINLHVSTDKTTSVVIEAQYNVTIPAERDIALTISFSSITSREVEQVQKYSNILVRVEDEEQYAVVKYSCKEPAFGFPFDSTGYVQQLMPINLHSPQFKQEDKVYTKLNGEQVVLYASITKEYDGETDYIPMEWHEKILMALSCDEVYINGEKVTKSGNYEIDHDNCTYSDCGIKLMRATFKVTTNVTQRNSNY